MRIRGYDEETESYTNDVEELSGKIADLTKTASTPGGISLFTDASKTEFKSTYQLLDEISKVYSQMTDKNQAQLLEVLAGKRQGQIVAATLNNFDAARKALDDMANSAGNADAEMAVIMDSLEYKLNALKETGVGIAQNLFQRDDMKLIVDGATSVLHVIDLITEKLGLFGTVGAGVGIFELIKNFQTLKSTLLEISSPQIISALSNIGSGSIQSIADAIDGLTLRQAQAVLSTTGLTQAKQHELLVSAGLIATESSLNQTMVLQAMEQSGLSAETTALVATRLGLTTATATCTAAELKEQLTLAGVSATTQGAIVSNLGLSASNVSTAMSFDAIVISAGAALKSVAAFLFTNPIGWLILGAGALAGIVAGIDAVTESFEEATEKAHDSKQAYEDSKNGLTTLETELQNVANRMRELESMESLSLTEQEEYDNLVLQNEQLERKIQLQERLVELDREQAAKDAGNVLSKKDTYSDGLIQKTDASGGIYYEPTEYSGDILDKIIHNKDQINKKEEEYNRILKEQTKLNPKSIEYENNNARLKEIEHEKDNLRQMVAEDEKFALDNYYTLLDANGNVISGYEQIAKKAEEVLLIGGESIEGQSDIINESTEIVDQYAKTIETLQSKVDNFAEHQKLVTDALESSSSAAGLNSEQLNALFSAYGMLESFDSAKLFEETANGIHLNRDELKKLEEEYQTRSIENYAQKAKELQEQIYRERAKGNDTSVLEDEYNRAVLLEQQYRGLTSAYNDWLKAKSGTTERESYENVGSSYSDMKEILDQGWYGDESLNAYLDMLLSASQRTGDAIADFEKLNTTIEGTSRSLMDYWQYDSETKELVSDGLYNFLDDVNLLLGDGYAKIDENGKYQFNFDGDRLKTVADTFGTTTEAIELFERALISAGNTVDLSDLTLGEEISESFEFLNTHTQSVFGNIDTNNRQVLEWTKENLNKYKEELQSWDEEAYTDWNKFSNEIEGSKSTVYGASSWFESKSGGIEIAFSPMLQTESGAELLSRNSVESYINDLIHRLDIEHPDGWDLSDIISLDKNAMNEGFQYQGLIADIGDTAIQTGEQMHNAGKYGYEWYQSILENIDTEPIHDVADAIAELESQKAFIDVETNPEAAAVLDDVINKCKQEYYFRLNAETDGALDRAIEIVNELDTVKTLDVKVNNFEQIESLATEISELPENVQIAIGIESSNVGDVQGIISQIGLAPESISVPVNYEKGKEPEKVDDADGVANYALGKYPKMVPPASGQVNFRLGKYPTSIPSINQTVYQNFVQRGGNPFQKSGKYAGTAYSSGSDWSLHQDEDALVNELGTESIVRDGKWFTIPGGAHFEQLQKGDIVFSAEQTKELIRTGKIVSGGGHGYVAHANGTAYNTLNAYENGSNGKRRPSSGSTHSAASNKSSSKKSKDSSGNSSNNNSKSSSNSKSTSNSSSESSDSEDEFEETFDWIEVAIQRVSDAIDRIKTKVDSTFKAISKRNIWASDEIELLTYKLEAQGKAYEKYTQQAESVELSDEYKQKVQSGKIDIDTITDEDLSNKIKEYQDYYDKAMDSWNEIVNIEEEISTIYQDRFDNITTDYESQLNQLEHLTASYENGISKIEAKGLLGGVEYYKSMQKIETESQQLLKNQLNAMEGSLAEAVNSGYIEMYSESWYEMRQSINEVREAIDESELSVIELGNSVRDIDWKIFDYIQERISAITNESNFIIGLMSSNDMVDKKGNFTDQGKATIGLHGQNYNVYMHQADMYREEMEKVNETLANDPNNTELINRKQELIELQQESILNAEKEKEAISDLVEEGIQAELNSLNELIDAYTDSLDSAKSLYDYQKKVEKQTAKISSLEKQLSAYQGDDSEETRTIIQKLTVDLKNANEDLEAAEYDKYVSDQKKLLDQLYIDYETVLNERLDNLDALVSEMIDYSNANASDIMNTITMETKDVGYVISESINSIWNVDGSAISVITRYGDNFSNQLTTVNSALKVCADYINSINQQAESEASQNTQSEQSYVEQSYSPPTAQSQAPSSTISNPPSTSSSGNSSGLTDNDYYGVALAIWNGGYGWGKGSTRVQRLQEKGFDAGRVQSIVNQLGREGLVHNSSWIGHYQGIKDLGSYSYNQYAVGLKKAYRDENAWVNELGSESIINPSKNAIITHIAKGSSVLNADATNNIWDMANNPSDFINKRAFAKSGGVSSTPIVNNTVSFDNVDFNLPNVHDYSDFMRELQNDKKFEKMVQSMTVGRVFGKSEIEKHRYKW